MNLPEKIFNKQFKSSIRRDQFSHNKKKVVESDLLIGYALKFMRKPLAKTELSEKEAIRKKLVKEFRKNNGYSRLQFIYAAAIILPLLFIGVGYWLNPLLNNQFFNHTAQLITFKTENGEQSNVTLPDGTLVKLNYSSELIYEINNRKQRIVRLDGEAYFDVTKNKQKPFVVKTAHFNVNVTGTKFNVKAYANEQKSSAALVEGSIHLTTSDNKTIRIQPGEKITYNQEKYSRSHLKVSSELAWKNGHYKFHKTPLQEIFHVIERMHDVRIRVTDQSILNEHFSGSINKREDVNRVLDEVIGLIIPITYTEENGEILINRKK
ncbi:DUF4974 domain-containing protein [Prolixibacteraceae bacterium JC049]|nr:DUF4974 domain-containing protein [Prolixibacteraceae bacterium JC049]